MAPIEEICIDGHCVEIRNCSVLFNIAMNPGITQKDRKYLQDRRCNKNANSFSVSVFINFERKARNKYASIEIFECFLLGVLPGTEIAG